MIRGARFLTAAAAVAVAACTADTGKVEIRSTATPLSATSQPLPARIAEARGQLALGNVALALESFRKAAREQPNSVEAFAGMAECYDRMGRFDLSRRNYEAALALAPASPALLTAFAGSLDQQGKPAEALAVRGEIRSRAALREAQALRSSVRAAATQSPVGVERPAATALAATSPIAKPVHSSSTPSVRPATVQPVRPAQPVLSSSVTFALPAATPVKAPAEVAVLPKSDAVPITPAPVRRAPLTTQVAAEQLHLSGRYDLAATPLRPIVKQELAEKAPVAAGKPSSTPAPANRQALGGGKSASRLERLSLGEVALLTTARSPWRAQVVEAKPRSTTIRFVPLRTAQARTPGIRLLNAARFRGLAANTRTMLAGQGWQRLAIGNATHVRQTSLILYPAKRREAAERLAAQFGYRIAPRASGTELIVLLGRDAARNMPARRHG